MPQERQIQDLSQAVKPLLIIASGPSVNEVNLSLFSDFHVMIINRPAPIKATYWHLNDRDIVIKYQNELKSFDGLILTNTGCKIPLKNVKYFAIKRGMGWTDEPNHYHLARTSTWSAMQVAVKLGYKKIVVIGIDQGFTNKPYYGDHEYMAEPEHRQNKFNGEAAAFEHFPQEHQDKFLFCANNKYEWFAKSKWHCSPNDMYNLLPSFLSQT